MEKKDKVLDLKNIKVLFEDVDTVCCTVDAIFEDGIETMPITIDSVDYKWLEVKESFIKHLNGE